MAGRTHGERDDFESRFFEQQRDQFDRFEDKLDKNTDIAKEALGVGKQALSEAKITNSRVTHLEDNVKVNLAEAHKISKKAFSRANRVHTRLVDLEKVLLPNKPLEVETEAVIKDKIESGDVRIPREVFAVFVKIVAIAGTVAGIIAGVINASN